MPRKTTANSKSSGVDFFANLKVKAGSLQKMAEEQDSNSSFDGEALDKIEFVPIDMILPNPDQPRRTETPDADNELMEDIKAHGILQPILVRVIEGTSAPYQLIAGERRTRAAKAAGLSVVPVIVKDYDDREARTIAAIENLQRKDLEPLDEASYFKFLAQEYNLSNRDIAQLIHKSASYIDQRMRLLTAEETKRVKSTQKLQNSQEGQDAKQPWKYRPKEWEKMRLSINLARTSVKAVKPEEREALRKTVQELKKELEELETRLGE